MRRNFMALIGALFCMASHAASIEQPLANAAEEARARTIFHELKCVVCEGQSLADSDAALAKQMRARVREMVSDGASTPEILSYFRERYGDRILLTPPWAGNTALLWLAPPILLLIGGILIRRSTRLPHHGEPS